MVWLAVSPEGEECIYNACPTREYYKGGWWWRGYKEDGDVSDRIVLPKGSIKKLIGRELKWEEEPVELK